jgi:predicted Rossmann fold flavoprotein
MLFTHRGLSGPAILQISSYWREGQEIVIDLLPDVDAAVFLKERKRSRPKAELRTVLAELMPQRLAAHLAIAGAIGERRDRELEELAQNLKTWRLMPTGSEGYAKAEVTLGGVDTHGLSSRTMEARNVPGLFVIGEAVDVTGWLGGYNFQWAWSSGWVAGEAA